MKSEIDSDNVNGVQKAGRNPSWSWDELMLALDLYFTLDYPTIAGSPPQADIDALSDILNRLSIHVDRPDATRFRNPNGVKMKLSNFLALDPSTTWAGLKHGSKLDAQVWDRYWGDRAHLHELAEAIRVQVLSPQPTITESAADGDYEASEGAVLLRAHRFRERNATLVKTKKERAKAKLGALRCEVCDFAYSEKYGDLGDGFIECHHTVPVSQLRPGQRTRLQDLVLVCADCHRMIHRRSEPLTIAALRDIVQARRQEGLI